VERFILELGHAAGFEQDNETVGSVKVLIM